MHRQQHAPHRLQDRQDLRLAVGDLAQLHHLALYRVAQEALTNIERHAGATQVDLRFASSGSKVEMEITDNGHGFPVDDGDTRAAGGLGLRNMEERMTHFGGRLEVESSRRGTVLRAILPISTMKDRSFPWREAAE